MIWGLVLTSGLLDGDTKSEGPPRSAMRMVNTAGDAELATETRRRVEEAIDMGEKKSAEARGEELDLSDPSASARLYSNTALAEWILEKNEDALLHCLEAVVIQDELINRLYFAHALIKTGRLREAEKYLRGFMAPVTPENMSSVVTSHAGSRHAPGYLLWILADPDASPEIQAARVYTALRQARAVTEYKGTKAQTVVEALDEAVSYLTRNQGVCFDFMLVPSTRKQLERVVTKLRTAGNQTVVDNP